MRKGFRVQGVVRLSILISKVTTQCITEACIQTVLVIRCLEMMNTKAYASKSMQCIGHV